MFLDYKDLSSRECYEYYKSNRSKVSKTIDQYNYFKKAVEGLFLTLRQLLLNNTEGVCIRDFGYLCNIRTKEKRKVLVLVHIDSILKRKRRSYIYNPYYFPDNMYEEWTMDYSFSPYIKDKLSRGNKEYNIHKTICDSVIIAEDFNIIAQRNKKNPKRNKNYKIENRI